MADVVGCLLGERWDHIPDQDSRNRRGAGVNDLLPPERRAGTAASSDAPFWPRVCTAANGGYTHSRNVRAHHTLRELGAHTPAAGNLR